MPTLDDVLQSIDKITDEMTAEQDKKGLSPFYTKGNDIVQQWLAALGYTLTDIEYLDSYFIMGHGTNSIMHFHIKEIPGFLFGLWWNPEWSDNFLYAECFAQFEEEIDKFKPSRSTFCETVYLAKEDFDKSSINESGFFKLYEMLEFMRDYPRLAWYQEMYSLRPYGYVSNTKAKFAYVYYRITRFTNKLLKRYADWHAFRCIPKIFRKHEGFNYIYHCNMYPSHEIVIMTNELEQGMYHWDDLDTKSYTKWADHMDRFQNRINRLLNNDYWDCPYDGWIYIVPEEK